MNIIITGASRGIGYETAKLLSQDHTVIAISRSAEKNKLPGVISISFDFETGNVKNDLLPQIKNHFQEVDVLINNSAAFVKKPFSEITPEDFEKIFRVNVFAIAELTRMMLASPLSPLLSAGRRSPSDLADKEKGAPTHVLNIVSMGGIQGSRKFPGLSAYSSSKGALITLTECLAEEYKNKNISFNAIAFGSVQTEMLEAAFPGFKAPLSAKEAAAFTAHFAINGNKYFNGKILQMALSTP